MFHMFNMMKFLFNQDAGHQPAILLVKDRGVLL